MGHQLASLARHALGDTASDMPVSLQEVAEVLDCYRTDDRWWMAEPIARTYYELLLGDGRTVTVFRDGICGGWWEQRYG